MSHTRPKTQSELSPPASPSEPQFSAASGTKKIASKRLPISPPASACPSPAHVSAGSSPHTSLAGATAMPAPTTSTMTSSHASSLKPDLRPAPAAAPVQRTSSKHRLDEEDITEEPNKRQRTDHDRVDNEKPSESTEAQSGPVNLEDFYCLSSQTIPRSNPHPTDDLFELYNLESLAHGVRRKDPSTGEKINKLRKSYESKVKEFKGKNKPVSKEGEFFHLLNYPDEEWNAQQYNGREISSALGANGQSFSDDMARKVDAALTGLSSGPLPDNVRNKWRSLLELESAAPKLRPQDPQVAAHPQTKGQTGRPPLEEPLRPRRRGTKRNYNDDAFEGYNEGYADDHDDDASADDDDRRSSISTGSRKRRRKDDILGPHMAATTPQWIATGGRRER